MMTSRAEGDSREHAPSTRRQFLVASAKMSGALLSAGLLAACGGTTATAPASPSSAASSAAPASAPPSAAPSSVAPSSAAASAPASSTAASVAASSAPASVAASPSASASAAGQHITMSVLLANHVAFYAYAKSDYEKQHNVTINLTREQFAVLDPKFATAFASGGPTWDVAYMWRPWVEEFRNYLTPLDELGFTPDSSDMLPVSIKQAKASDGKWYGMPSNTYTYVLYGNKKRLDAAGIKMPTTYDEFVAASKALTKGDQFGYVDGWAPGYLFPKWVVWLGLNGGNLYDGTGPVKFDTPQARQATTDMKALLPYMPKEVITSPWGIYDVEAKKIFLGGKAAMMIDYQHLWYESGYQDISTLGGDVYVSLVPGGKQGGPKSATQYTGECFVIPKTSQFKQQALDLIKYYSNPQTQLGLLTQRPQIHQFDPAGEDGFPAYKSDYTNPAVPTADKSIVDVTLQQQQFPGDRYEALGKVYQKVSDTIEAQVSAALTGQQDIAAAHAAGQKAIDQIMASAK